MIFSRYAMPKVLKRMGLRQEEFSMTEGALDAVMELYQGTSGIRDLEQAARVGIAANALYQIEVDQVSSVQVDREMVERLLA